MTLRYHLKMIAVATAMLAGLCMVCANCQPDVNVNADVPPIRVPAPKVTIIVEAPAAPCSGSAGQDAASDAARDALAE